jgi:hypothetical protein
VPHEVLLPFLDLWIGVAWAVSAFRNNLCIPLDLNSVFFIVRVEYLDDGLLRVVPIYLRVSINYVFYPILLEEVHGLVGLPSAGAWRAALGILAHVFLRKAYSIAKHLVSNVAVEIDVHLPDGP